MFQFDKFHPTAHFLPLGVKGTDQATLRDDPPPFRVGPVLSILSVHCSSYLILLAVQSSALSSTLSRFHSQVYQILLSSITSPIPLLALLYVSAKSGFSFRILSKINIIPSLPHHLPQNVPTKKRSLYHLLAGLFRGTCYEIHPTSLYFQRSHPRFHLFLPRAASRAHKQPRLRSPSFLI
jgi:hypothetical protein